jgi:hypothetical protein
MTITHMSQRIVNEWMGGLYGGRTSVVDGNFWVVTNIEVKGGGG